MQLILPDVVAAARGLSLGAAGFLLAIGLLLWAYGWVWHRFWVVFGITMGAGLIGLSAGRAAGGQQVLVVGVLMAVAAGMLAMEAAKLLAFATGGTAAWLAFQLVLPHAQELWAAFLSGGLIGIVLFRLWTMLVTSLAGSLVAGHSGLVLLSEVAKFDASGWAGQHTAALNGAVVAAALVGVVVQAKMAAAETAKPAPEPEPEPPPEPPPKEEPAKKPEPPPPPPKPAKWWARFLKVPKLS